MFGITEFNAVINPPQVPSFILVFPLPVCPVVPDRSCLVLASSVLAVGAGIPRAIASPAPADAETAASDFASGFAKSKSAPAAASVQAKEKSGSGSGTFLRVTLSCDQRAVDADSASRWLAAFKALVEQPASLLL